MTDLEPAAIMVAGPGPGFLRNKRPAAVVALLEVSIGVRTPTTRDIPGLPAPAFSHQQPVAIRVERVAAIEAIARNTDLVG